MGVPSLRRRSSVLSRRFLFYFRSFHGSQWPLSRPFYGTRRQDLSKLQTIDAHSHDIGNHMIWGDRMKSIRWTECVNDLSRNLHEGNIHVPYLNHSHLLMVNKTLVINEEPKSQTIMNKTLNDIKKGLVDGTIRLSYPQLKGEFPSNSYAQNSIILGPSCNTTFKEHSESKYLLDSAGVENMSRQFNKESLSSDIKEREEGKAEKNIGSDETFERTQEELRMELSRIYDKVLVVDNVKSARYVVKLLTTKYRSFIHACDTEVTDFNVREETPVGHGKIVCFSIYSCSSNYKADFGNGKSCIWIDLLDSEGDLLKEFAPFFEDPSIKKVWHNYSFDSHFIQNSGIKLAGFHADTIHLARLWNSSRRISGGYSLEALTSDPTVMDGKPDPTPTLQKTGKPVPINPEVEVESDPLNIPKMSMKAIFGKGKVRKDGSRSKVISVDPVQVLQREEKELWICYSALDSVCTLKLYESLKKKLSRMEWVVDRKFSKGNMFNFYMKYWKPFGELLVRMERVGMYVNRSYLAEIEIAAVCEQKLAEYKFRRWVSKKCPQAKYMNIGSGAQTRQLLFGGTPNGNDENEVALPEERTFRVLNTEAITEEGKKRPTKYRSIMLNRITEHNLSTDTYTPSGLPSVKVSVLKSLAGKIPPELIYTTKEGSESDGKIVNSSDSKPKEKGDLLVEYGSAYKAFGGKGRGGEEACCAIAALCEVCSIEKLISSFIRPLQGNQILCERGRVHCSLNINTETGRLSARTPNLQNQPALEKDRYKIRQAFTAEPGNSLIVADYGQLELRILAHLTNCKSMLEAFRLGGDFHSRTAMNMYDYIKQAVDNGEVILEWDPKPGEEKPPKPLLKDVYASERRKAKMLNFSIAYGKTPMGIACDWKVTLKEAKQTLNRWYREREEVKKWQWIQRKQAMEKQRVKTLLGRARCFPQVDKNMSSKLKGHIERAAINSPVQGSAADVAMCAMLMIDSNTRLKELGWKLLLQVHDEVILEGPSKSAEEAKSIVVECMKKPFDGRNILNVNLAVDAKCAQSWYEAK